MGVFNFIAGVVLFIIGLYINLSVPRHLACEEVDLQNIKEVGIILQILSTCFFICAITWQKTLHTIREQAIKEERGGNGT